MRTVSRKSKQLASPYANLVISSFCMLLFLSNIALAEKTVKTVEIPFGYVAQTTANQWYPKDITLSSPDGIEQILFMEIILKGDFQANTKVYVQIEGQNCRAEFWTIPNQDVANYEMKFDCSNLANGRRQGTYTIRIKTDKISQNVYATIRFTYLNNPRASFELHGTEYEYGQDAKIWLQLLDAEMQYIDDSICYIHVFSPDNEEYIDKGIMTNLAEGIYYHDFAVPVMEGTYPMTADCIVGENVTQVIEYADHYWLINGTYQSGSVSDTYTDDEEVHTFEEDVSTESLIFGYNFTDFCEGNDLYSVSVYWQGIWRGDPSNDDIIISLWNYTDSSWYDFGNRIIPSVSEQSVANSLMLSNLTDFSSSGELKIKFEDTIRGFPSVDLFKTDLLWASCDRTGGEESEWQIVRGGSEMHVTSELHYRSFLDTVKYIPPSGPVWMGFLEINYTIASETYKLEEDVRVYFHSPYQFVCKAIHTVEIQNKTNPDVWHEMVFYTAWHSEGEHCDVHVHLDLEANENYQFRILMKNYYEKYATITQSEEDLIYALTNGICLDYQISNSLANYSIPMSVVPDADDFYDSCAHYLNGYYQLNDSISELQSWTQNNLTDGMSLDTYIDLHSRLLRIHEYMREIEDHLFMIISSSADYSHRATELPPEMIPSFGLWFGNLSTPYRILQALGYNETEAQGLGVVGMWGKLLKIQEEITSVNDTVKNESVQIQTNQQEIYNWLQNFNITVDNLFNNVFANQQEILNGISNITFNISTLNSTVMNKLYLIQDEIASINSTIISARVDILNQMVVNYNSLVSILNNLPTNILGSFEQQTPNWFKCIAQRLTGVYPAGSEC